MEDYFSDGRISPALGQGHVKLSPNYLLTMFSLFQDFLSVFHQFKDFAIP